PRFFESRRHIGVLAMKVRVAVQRQKHAPQQRQRPPQRARGSQQRRPVKRILHFQSEGAPIFHHAAHHFTQKPHAQHHAGNAAGLQQSQLVRDERLAIHVQQRFRDLLGRRPQPRRQSSRKYRHRQHASFFSALSLLRVLCASPLPTNAPP